MLTPSPAITAAQFAQPLDGEERIVRGTWVSVELRQSEWRMREGRPPVVRATLSGDNGSAVYFIPIRPYQLDVVVRHAAQLLVAQGRIEPLWGWAHFFGYDTRRDVLAQDFPQRLARALSGTLGILHQRWVASREGGNVDGFWHSTPYTEAQAEAWAAAYVPPTPAPVAQPLRLYWLTRRDPCKRGEIEAFIVCATSTVAARETAALHCDAEQASYWRGLEVTTCRSIAAASGDGEAGVVLRSIAECGAL